MRRRTIKEDGPDPIDAHVGDRLRTLRMSMRISQTQLGNVLGVTFQQLQKYENGTNRISASKLFKTSKMLGVDVTYFFAGLPDNTSKIQSLTGSNPNPADNALRSPEAARFARDVMSIPDPSVRKRIRELAVAVTRADG